MITSAFMPMITAGVTLLVYIVGWPDGRALCIGILAGLLGWGIIALVAQYFVTVEHANPDVYRELQCRFAILQEKMRAVREPSPNPAQPPCEDPYHSIRREIATAEIKAYLSEIGRMLAQKRAAMKPQGNEDPLQDWVLGYGYITLRKQIHRVEENFLLIVPPAAVHAEARYDRLRLEDSTIPNHDTLLSYLDSAVAVLEDSQKYQPRQSPSGENPSTSRNSPPVEWMPKDEPEAREALRQVRRTINEFRDERRIGIVRARNRLLRTLTLTGLITFLLVALAALTPDAITYLRAGATFFLVGSIVGVFNQLYLDARTEVATEDYGLSVVRLLHTPLISGLAALGSVLIIPALSAVIHLSTPGNTGPGLTVPGPTVPVWDAIFDLKQRPLGLVLAAIFGMSPVVLIRRLQQEANRYKAELKSSEVSSHRPGVNATL
jgi:hypothetical protein